MRHELIIAFRPRLSLDQFFFWSQVVVGIIGFILLLIFFMQRGDVLEVRMDKTEEKSLALDQMLTGPLALRENCRSPLALALEQKLVFLAQSMRPDIKQEEKVFRIGVKGSEIQQIVKEGRPIYCNLVEHASGGIEAVEFLEKKGGTAMVPHVLDARSLLLKVEEASGEIMEVILKASADMRKTGSAGPEVEALQGAKWWGQDLFFREYGGKEYRPMSLKHQVEVSYEKDRYVLYLGAEDFLSFRQGKWEVISSLEKAKRDAPLARVQNLSQNVLEIEVWDANGFLLFQTKLQQEKAPVLRFIPEQVIQGAKLRTARQVSCKMGKKRFVLQPGDWLLKTQMNWHKLKTSEEIEAFLNHDFRGELFIVDGIDAKGKVSGRYFNEMRTQMTPFSFQAISSKGNKKGKTK